MALTKVTGDMTSGIADESGLTSVQTFTSSGTWTRPSGVTKVIVEVQGGGSSGNQKRDKRPIQRRSGRRLR